MKILIVGAGVIGQIYAARLHEAGHEVTVLARHQTLQTLIQDGITLVNQGSLQTDTISGTGTVSVAFGASNFFTVVPSGRTWCVPLIPGSTR